MRFRCTEAHTTTLVPIGANTATAIPYVITEHLVYNNSEIYVSSANGIYIMSSGSLTIKGPAILVMHSKVSICGCVAFSISSNFLELSHCHIDRIQTSIKVDAGGALNLMGDVDSTILITAMPRTMALGKSWTNGNQWQ